MAEVKRAAFHDDHLEIQNLRYSTQTLQNSQPSKIPRHCGHTRPIVRNVTAPYGEAAYICRSCFTYLRTIEVRAVEVSRVRRELSALFRNSWPPGFNPEAAAREVAI